MMTITKINVWKLCNEHLTMIQINIQEMNDEHKSWVRIEHMKSIQMGKVQSSIQRLLTSLHNLFDLMRKSLSFTRIFRTSANWISQSKIPSVEWTRASQNNFSYSFNRFQFALPFFTCCILCDLVDCDGCLQWRFCDWIMGYLSFVKWNENINKCQTIWHTSSWTHLRLQQSTLLRCRNRVPANYVSCPNWICIHWNNLNRLFDFSQLFLIILEFFVRKNATEVLKSPAFDIWPHTSSERYLFVRNESACVTVRWQYDNVLNVFCSTSKFRWRFTTETSRNGKWN